MTSNIHQAARPEPTAVGRRSVVRSSAALGVTAILLPSAAQAASTVATTTYTTVENGGTLFVWGKALVGSALGTNVSDNSSVVTPRLMTGGTSDYTAAEIVKALPAYYASIALAADGSMFAWGNSVTNASDSTRSAATKITSWYSDDTLAATVPQPTIVDFSPSQRAVVAVGSDGHIYAWGTQWGSEAGLPDGNANATPRRVTGTLGLSDTVDTADRITQVSGNNRLMVWLDGDGKVRTSGTQDSFRPAQLGRGSGNATSATAQLVAGSLSGTAGTATRIVQIAAGSAFVLALGRDGRVHAWGSNASGQLGDASTDNKFEPVDITSAAGTALPAANSAGRIVQVSAGRTHSLALGLDGRVYAWGNSSDGRLGIIDPAATETVPVEITGNGDLPEAGGPGRIVQVVAADASSYALGADGSVYSWGSGDGGRLGTGDTTSRSTPVRIWDQGAFVSLAPYATDTQRRIMFLGAHRGSNESAHIFALDNLSAVA